MVCLVLSIADAKLNTTSRKVLGFGGGSATAAGITGCPRGYGRRGPTCVIRTKTTTNLTSPRAKTSSSSLGVSSSSFSLSGVSVSQGIAYPRITGRLTEG